MPPKRAPKAPPAAAAAVSTRSSRSRTKATAAAATDTQESLDSKPSSGKRKRIETLVVDADSASEVEVSQAKTKAKAASKKTKAATSPTKKARTTTSKKANAPFTKKACEKWFETLEDADSPGSITHNTIPKWLEDLEVSPEGIVFYLIAWKCKAKHTFTISKEEFLTGMTVLGVDSDDALLRKLPVLLKEATPSHTNQTFDNFYKFCFNYFKPTDVKNLAWDVASELLTSLLDPARYSLTWSPLPEEAQGAGETKGDFPHRKAFVEFLSQEPSPVQVITRDQYDQFLPFNRDVPWNLEGFKEEESTWPTLMDTYIVWRKEKYPLPEKNKEPEED